MSSKRDDAGKHLVRAAFGAANRNKLIDSYLAETRLEAARAWSDVYRLLLWVDQSTGLAHCYESDKSQPGKNWYARSLAFHEWVAAGLGTTPSDLGEQIDWLFRRVTADLAESIVRRQAALLKRAASQFEPYASRGFPEPGEDPELVAIIRDLLGDFLASEPPADRWQLLAQRVRQHLKLENKRRNLLGEGFEDVLAAIIRRAVPDTKASIHTREPLHNLPGFNRARRGDKPSKVDLAIVRRADGRRLLATAKWSVRADREKQFSSDHDEYVAAESNREPFDYVFVTNEFDPARLMRACEALAGNALMFAAVVHISPDALIATYGTAPERSMKKVIDHISAGRLIGLAQWLEGLGASP